VRSEQSKAAEQPTPSQLVGKIVMIEFDDSHSAEAQVLSTRLTSAGAKVTLVPSSQVISHLNPQTIDYCYGANLGSALAAKKLAETLRMSRDDPSTHLEYQLKTLSPIFCQVYYAGEDFRFDLAIVLWGA